MYCLLKNIMAHLDENTFVRQTTCIPQKALSCKTHLVTIIIDLAKTLVKSGQVDTFTLDFEKAFNIPLQELPSKCKL